MNRRLFLLSGAAAAFAPASPVLAQGCPGYGRFIGDLDLRALPDGRHMKLLRDYGYVDASGLAWNVPAGVELDGASIPPVFWSVTGGPWDGPYRNASVIHDWFCDTRARPWQSVHRMFHEAMLANCTSRIKASVMYAAVWAGGPRWPQPVQRNAALSAMMDALASDYALTALDGTAATADPPPAAPDMTAEQFRSLAARIESEQLTSPEQIEALVGR